MTATNKCTGVFFTVHHLCTEEQSMVWYRIFESNDGLLVANQNLVPTFHDAFLMVFRVAIIL